MSRTKKPVHRKFTLTKKQCNQLVDAWVIINCLYPSLQRAKIVSKNYPKFDPCVELKEAFRCLDAIVSKMPERYL